MKRFNAAVFCLLLVAIPGNAEEEPERPKIGLALAGGGAKGIAHIGVLEALAELNIPVDYVAGTSMGSIIGGLYASGIDPAELAVTIAEIDWDDVMRDNPDRRALSFRRKQDDQRYTMDLEIGVKRWDLEMPPGLQTGQKLTLLLQWLSRHVANVRDFDDLPTPFRCVAADINSGKPVVIGSGDLAWAMRASMAIPSIFTPVELDGKTLVDGGIVNNVPVDVVRAMGADIVIAVDLGAPLDTKSVQGWFGVVRQLTRMLTRVNMEPQLASADLVLRPPGVSAYGTLDFSAVEEIYDLGRQAVENDKAKLLELALAPEEYARFAARHSRPEEPQLTVASIQLEGNERVDSRIIENTMTLTPGDALDFEQLAEDISTVYGLGDFDQIGFELEPVEVEEADLSIKLREKPWGPNYLRFGLFFESDLKGEFLAAGLVNFTMTRINERGAEWRNDLRIGRLQGVVSEFFQPLGFEGHWFVAPIVIVDRKKSRLYLDGEAVAEINDRRTILNASVGYQSSRFAEARLGIEIGKRRIDQVSGAGLFDLDTDATVGGIRTRGEVDSKDDAFFPSLGTIGYYDLFFSREELGSEDNYTKAELKINHFVPRGKSRFIFGLELGAPLGDRPIPSYDLFTLGGFGSLSGFKNDELRGQYKGVGRLGYYRVFGERFRIGGWFELGNVWLEREDVDFDDTIFSTTAFLGLETLFGPVILGWGVNDVSESEVYLTIGRVF